MDVILTGLLSLTTSPSRISINRVAYCLAKSRLWLTNITNLSLDISFKISIIIFAFLESSAPVGSSARIMLGSFTIARAIATL